MSNLQQLRADREVAKNTILQLRDAITKGGDDGKGREFNTEERASWDKANKDFDRLNDQVMAIERGEGLSRADERPVPGAEDRRPGQKRNKVTPERREEIRALAMQGWFLGGKGGLGLTDKHERACKFAGVNPHADFLDLRLPSVRAGETRDMSVGTNNLGGYTVPVGFVANLDRAMKAISQLRQVADVMRTETGNPLHWPTIDDTANDGAAYAEAAAIASDENPTVGEVLFNAYKHSSKILKVSAELLQDTAFDLPSLLGDMLGERLARGQNPLFTTGAGSGSSQPKGIVTAASSGKTTASATAITMDELIDLEHSIDPAYRNDPSFAWMMHDSVLAYIRKLKDASGQYLWEPSTQAGVPGKLFNHAVYNNQDMASSVATGNKTVLVGALKKFKIRDAGSVRLVRLNELYAANDQVGFVALIRSDSNLLTSGSVKYLTQA